MPKIGRLKDIDRVQGGVSYLSMTKTKIIMTVTFNRNKRYD